MVLDLQALLILRVPINTAANSYKMWCGRYNIRIEHDLTKFDDYNNLMKEDRDRCIRRLRHPTPG